MKEGSQIKDEKIKMNDSKNVCVVGLGYVGLPLALLTREKGHQVTGLDINRETIEKLKQGLSPIKDKEIQDKLSLQNSSGTKIRFTSDMSMLQSAEIIIVCVPTPVDAEHKPNLRHLKSACQTIAYNIKPGQLVIIESTIFPGTMQEIVLPFFQKPDFNIGSDFFLAHCPERLDPGNKIFNIGNIPRVVGGITENCALKAKKFYQTLISAPVIKLSNIKAVETTKVVENTFRDVNIALVNELAIAFDTMGIDVLEVIKGASTKPFAFMAHFPGCGVGGHCIPVDPYYLIEKSREQGFNPRFLSMARQINDDMPLYTVQKTRRSLQQIGIMFEKARIAILGVSYKAGVDDIRESPALRIIEELQKEVFKLDIFDPYTPNKSTVSDLDSALQSKDCAILATNHPEFKDIEEKLSRHGIKVVIDGRNFLDKDKIIKLGMIYRGIGR